MKLIELNFKDKLNHLDEKKNKSLDDIFNKFNEIKKNLNNFQKESILKLIKKRTSFSFN